MVFVRRLDASETPPPPKRGGKRVSLGIDPLEDDEAPRALKSSIERVVGDLAERRDEK